VEDLFWSACETNKERKLPWTKVKGVTTDGAASMTGNKTGLAGRTRCEMDKENLVFYNGTSLYRPKYFL
jgi:hypothetical protein